ncbi:hypothetical protein [Sphingobium nicotianae]|uniref:Uncharacterized protein n=1 Tax=Sphingobium nicotianae TaxID=2782607 RepID=A0A9X1DEM1_9SPHN|nr:hypothetical protein [Sphingobium nicotianae]MBT2188528.1 hypothetical protein [Sphingobium nicotianae]
MTDSNRTSASTGLPTPVDDGTPAGHPTPAGEPSSGVLPPASSQSSSSQSPAPVNYGRRATDQIELFPGLRSCADGDVSNRPLLEAIGGLILAWGRLERTTAEKLAVMRESFGDVRAVGGRTRPTMQKLLAELRALVAMRDRHDKQVLTVIADIDGTLQRTAQFRLLLVDGTQDVQADGVECRDLKNSLVRLSAEEIARETAQLERIREQISGL